MSRSVSSMPSIRVLKRGLRALAGFGRHVVDRALEIVGDGQHVAGEIGDAVGARVRDLAFGAAAHVLDVGKRAQELVLQIRLLGFERRERIGLEGRRLRRVAGRAGAGIVRGRARKSVAHGRGFRVDVVRHDHRFGVQDFACDIGTLAPGIKRGGRRNGAAEAAFSACDTPRPAPAAG